MAYDPGAIDATLAAAVGDDPGLIVELRIALLESAESALAAMNAAEDSESWSAAAWRLRGLAASFGAVRLMALAMTAAEGTPMDELAVRKLRRVVERL